MLEQYLKKYDRTIRWVANKYISKDLTQEDTYQEALIAFIHAFNNFDFTRPHYFPIKAKFVMQEKLSYLVKKQNRKHRKNTIYIDDLVPEVKSQLFYNPNIPKIVDTQQKIDKLSKSLPQLDLRMREIITARYLVPTHTSRPELAIYYNISQQRVDQLEKQGLNNLRKIMC